MFDEDNLLLDVDNLNETSREFDSILPGLAYALGIIGAVALAYWVVR